MKPLRKIGVFEETSYEKSLGLGPYKRWFRHGWKSLHILSARLRNKHRPIFRLRMAWQRSTRGYGEDDLWSVNYALAKLTVAGCRYMRKAAHGYPAEFGDPKYGGNAQGWDAWDDILRRIEEGFQAWIDEDGWFPSNEESEQEAKFKDAMHLYSHWFGALWD